MTELRRGLPPLPPRFLKLPLDERGYPIPWFVAKLPDGRRDFRVANSNKRAIAVKKKLCWLCGEKVGRYMAFVIGPMCAVNRNTSEPPCHRDCAIFAATACPFLTRPKADYRAAGLPDGYKGHIGALPGNPGAACIWITMSYKPYQVPGGGRGDWLIRVGPPLEVLWFAEGKPATRQQILDSFNERLPLLREVAKSQSPAAEAALADSVNATMHLLPAE